MPLIMDDQQYIDGLNDMDDLFMEHHDALPAPQVSLHVKGLSARLDELHKSGCCKKLAWSKFGGIASIDPEGKTVHAQSFAFDSGKQEFFLTKPTPIQFLQGAVLQPFVHIEWNDSGLELAVVDASGRITLFTTIVALNRLIRVDSIATDHNDVFGSVVGLEWLPMNRMVGFYHSAVRTNETWEYRPTNPDQKGPRHPIQNKSALVAVTRRGSLYLVFSAATKGYADIHCDLGLEDTADTLLTHASIAGEQDGSLLIATIDSSNTLQLYRVKIDWHYPYNAKQPPPRDFQLTPTMDVQRILVHPDCGPHISGAANSATSQLCHLKILPATGDPASKQTCEATIMMVFSISESHTSVQPQSSSITGRVVRWEVPKAQDKLHACFDNLAIKKSKGSSSSVETCHIINRLEDIDISGAVVAINSARRDTIVLFSRADGVIEFRDRFFMTPMNAELQSESISNLLQTGFAFPSLDPFVSISFSANFCIAISRNHDNELKCNYVELLSDGMDTMDSEVRESAVIAGLSLVFASSMTSSVSTDDILALMNRNKHIVSADKFVDGIFTSIGVSVDYSIGETEHEKLIRNPFHPRCISALQLLGQQSSHQTISAKVAKSILNMRFVTLALHLASQGAVASADPELPYSFLGVLKWYLDLMAFIIDGILKLSRECRGKEGDRGFIQDRINAHNSPALLIVLCSNSRALLKFASRCLRSIINSARSLGKTESQAAKGWRVFLATIASAPLDPLQFENTLTDLNHHVVTAYSALSTSNATEMRRASEKQMLFKAEIPDALMPAIQRLLTTTSQKLFDNENVDPAAIFFADFRMLDITDDQRTREFHQENKIDVLRKIPLTGLTKLRRCTRCCAFMEDILPGPQSRPPGMGSASGQWILNLQKSCLCGNPWVLVEV